tara:strand:+ start:458 stop:991 length:534 start_codon:yes stop_codon:yes gene_type:complete
MALLALWITLLSNPLWSYLILGTVFKNPFESEIAYLTRTISVIGKEEVSNPSKVRVYLRKIKTIEWDDAKNELFKDYLRTPLINRVAIAPVELILIWPTQAIEECNKMMNSHNIYTKEELIKLLYLRYYLNIEQGNKTDAILDHDLLIHTLNGKDITKSADLSEISRQILAHDPSTI